MTESDLPMKCRYPFWFSFLLQFFWLLLIQQILLLIDQKSIKLLSKLFFLASSFRSQPQSNISCQNRHLIHFYVRHTSVECEIPSLQVSSYLTSSSYKHWLRIRERDRQNGHEHAREIIRTLSRQAGRQLMQNLTQNTKSPSQSESLALHNFFLSRFASTEKEETQVLTILIEN